MSWGKIEMPRLPFLHPLLKLKASSHKKALKELLISVVLSTLPIWLGGLLSGMIAKAKSDGSFFATALKGMVEFTSQGELYMLAVATLAPIFYIGNSLEREGHSAKSYRGPESKDQWSFPQLDIHRFFVALFITVASVVFFYMRKESVTGTDYVMSVSVFFYVASLFMMYAASAHNEERVSFQGFPESADDEREFQDDYSAHRSGT